MAKYKTETSKETVQQADKLAKANQRPGQTKEQTKLISQGIQKGIDQYKKQQKSKARELDKKLKSIKDKTTDSPIQTEKTPTNNEKYSNQSKFNIIPWFLLVASWVAFIVYIYS